jgi:hypothetical protein
VISTLDKYQRVKNSIDWRELELALHVLLLYGEAFKGQLVFVIKHNNETVAFTPLGEMFSKMIQCSKYVCAIGYYSVIFTQNFFY